MCVCVNPPLLWEASKAPAVDQHQIRGAAASHQQLKPAFLEGKNDPTFHADVGGAPLQDAIVDEGGHSR